ncbi:MAG: hypothetical protein WAX69_00875, partial [Victivallales bacterium]
VEDILSNYGQIEFKGFVGLLLKNSARGELPFEIESNRPLSVIIAEKRGVRILHVLNEGDFGSETDFSLSVKIPSGNRAVSAGCLIGGKPAKFADVKNGILLKKLRVSDYECIVIKFSPGKI